MDEIRAAGLAVAGGRFGAHMEVELVNDGPVTVLLDSEDWKRSRKPPKRDEAPERHEPLENRL